MTRRALKAVPRPLLLLLVAVALLGSFWALLVPPFQVPDEYAHFAYTQSVGERGKPPKRPTAPTYSTEQLRATELSNANQTSGIPATKTEWSRSVELQWIQFARTLDDKDRSDGAGRNPAAVNPPLYYLYSAGAYEVAGGDLFDRLYAVRLASILFLLVTVMAGWLLAGEIFGRDRLAQLVVAATCGMVPMVTYMSSSNNPDSPVYAVWTVALWLMARVVKRGGLLRDVAALALIVTVALATKAVSWALVPGVVLAVALAYLPALRLDWRAVAKRAAIALGIIGAGVVAWPFFLSGLIDGETTGQAGSAGGLAVTTGGSISAKEFVSYMLQFYLPKLPFLTLFPTLEPLPVYDTFLKGAWGSFGWLEVDLPGWIYTLLALLTTAIAAGTVLLFTHNWRTIDKRLPGVYALTTLALLAGLHMTEYKLVKSEHVPFNQGRYLLPLIGLAALAVVCAFRMLPERWFSRLAASWLVLLFGLQILSLATVAVRFYA